VRRKFNWALYACVTWGVVACGGSNPLGGATVEGASDQTGAASSGGANGVATIGQQNPLGSGTGSLVDDQTAPGYGGSGCVGAACSADDTPVGGGSLCGNGKLDEGEQCDDGNSQPGDGCSGTCKLEPNFSCPTPGARCVTTIVCGDGHIAGLEACDDGNVKDGDGCSSACSVESGFSCTTGMNGSSACAVDQSVVCGDSKVGFGEQCDDGNTVDGDGCSATCQVESGYVCGNVGSACTSLEYCGDGIVNTPGEECDDGNLSPTDGCDGTCHTQPNFTCPPAGGACHSTVVCGDGKITGNETCDDGVGPDGHPGSGDGCSALCRVEPGFDCTGGTGTPQAGPCTPVPEGRCGDARLAANEFCDDGNSVDGDGCSSTCTIEAGYDCPNGPGSLCVQVGRCGDGLVNVAGEQCDDGNTTGGDGCTAHCKAEALFSCPAGGGACTSTVVCGDGVVSGTETCDDHNRVSGDGCDHDCHVEAGFVCALGGVCRPVCGDGVRAGSEQCDDGNTNAGDGCDAGCRLEDGFTCDLPRSGGHDVCGHTTCGQKGREGTEQCDDGNLVPYDGCDPNCHNEPVCGNDANGVYGCDAVCGDGMKFPEEECDDGNTLDGDGCSSDCKLEPGFACTDQAPDLGSTLNLPIIYRDFSETHPQFEINPATASTSNGRLPGIVKSVLGADGKPVYNSSFVVAASRTTCGGSARPFTMDGPSGSTTGHVNAQDNGASACGAASLGSSAIATRFLEWYHDASSNVQILGTLPLGELAAGTYQFARSGTNQFFPIDGKGFGNEGQTTKSDGTGTSHNFHFTSEVRQWFEHGAGGDELLQFSGDDDVWVFVNGQLTVDLGGIHSELFGSIELEGDSGQDSILCVPGLNGTATSCSAFPVALNPDGVNEIAVFQAERHVTQSNYTLTLKGFNAPLTTCHSVCGDGVVTADEACDLGTARNTGAYGTCNSDCTLPARCGDGRVDASAGEECDNGLNTSTRQNNASDCAPGCKLPPRCGDGHIDGQFEACDNGSANAAPGTYGACGTDCQLGPSCGDGVVQAGSGEQCDDGSRNGSGGSPCLKNCTLRCGNGMVDQGEQCDDGLANNIGGYGHCQSDCTFGPRCGDAIVDPGEQCDDGLNDGAYGHCAPGCVAGPFCGDGHVDASSGESCDNGSNDVAASAYGPNLCTSACRPAPYCGDHTVNADHQEVCDDGKNDGTPGSCSSDCKRAIPLVSCGNGVVDPGEQCDNGSHNGEVVSGHVNGCDAHCRLSCGNGFVDPGEQCDNGVNDGSYGTYGTCKSDCSFADFCGDGHVGGSEICDQGASNVPASSAYGAGVCTTACAAAPRCGDHRVDTAFGEECDGSPGCTTSCVLIR
jgi:fibro-slime domain-containing protein